MSKHYTPSMKVKSGIGADGKFYIDVTSDDIGTVIVDGEAERIAWLLDLVRQAALEEAAKFVEENYEEEMINIVGNPWKWKCTGQ